MRLLTQGYSGLLVFSALAYSFWFNLLGLAGALALLIVLGARSTIIWLRTRRSAALTSFKPRRWLLIGVYLAFAFISVLWSSWPATTLATAVIQAGFVLQALFLVRIRRGYELASIVEVAAVLVLLLSVAMEIAVAAAGAPLLPNFLAANDVSDPHIYWVRGNLFEGGRIQGIVGNANLLAAVCVIVMILAALNVSRSRTAVVLRLLTCTMALWLLLRAGSAAMLLALIAMALVAVLTTLWSRTTTRKSRAVFIACSSAAVAILVAGAVAARGFVFEALGRSDSLTGRVGIWEKVLDRANSSPIAGNGYASPWNPWDSAFSDWITDHGLTVFHAHNMWIDIYMQLGGVGVMLLVSLVAAGVVHAWRRGTQRGVGRERLIPLMLVVLLLVQGLTESAPLMYWGLAALAILSAGASAPSRVRTGGRRE